MSVYPQYQQYKGCSKSTVVLAPTTADIEGPFYKSGAPERVQITTYPTATLTGRVLTINGDPIPFAGLDFWQANEKGEYDNVGFDLRGTQSTGHDGRYTLLTVHPGDYQIDVNEFRCAHIHVKVFAKGYKPLTTQLYFSDDQYNSSDHWFSKDRVIGSVNDRFYAFDLVLEKE